MAKPGKEVRKLEFKQCKVEIVSQDVTQELILDGKPVKTSRDSDTGAYVCSDLPYQEFGSLEEIAKALVDARGDNS